MSCYGSLEVLGAVYAEQALAVGVDAHQRKQLSSPSRPRFTRATSHHLFVLINCKVDLKTCPSKFSKSRRSTSWAAVNHWDAKSPSP
jgi:hypothetical protein